MRMNPLLFKYGSEIYALSLNTFVAESLRAKNEGIPYKMGLILKKIKARTAIY